MSSGNNHIDLRNIKEIKQKQIFYVENTDFIEKQKSHKYILCLTKFRLYKIKQKKFGRKSLQLSLPLCEMTDLLVGIHKDKYVVYMQFSHRGEVHEMDMAFRNKANTEKLIQTIADILKILRQVNPGFSLNLNLGSLMEVDFEGEFLDRKTRLGLCYEMLCDLNEEEPLESVLLGLGASNGETLDVEALFGRAEKIGETTCLKRIGETVKNVEDSFRIVRCCNMTLYDETFSTFAKNVLSNQNVKSLTLSDCRVYSAQCTVGIAESMEEFNPGIKTLDISHNPKIGDNGLQILCQSLGNSSIKRLNLSYCGFSGKGMESLALALSSKFLVQSVKHLDLTGNAIRKEGTAHLSRFLEDCENLRTLKLRMTEVTVNLIASALLKNEKVDLTYIDLSCSSKLDKNDSSALMRLLQFTKNLAYLGLAGCRLNEETFADIMDGLQANPDSRKGDTLRISLNLSETNFDAIPKGLISNPLRCVRKLNLSKTAYRNKDFIELIEQLENIKYLHSLNLSHCGKIGNFATREHPVGRHLTRFFHAMPRLQYVNLCAFSDIFSEKSSLEAFFGEMAVNNTLRRIDLDDCKLGDAEVDAMANFFEKNKTMKIITFDHNKISTNGMLKLISTLKVSKNFIGSLPYSDLNIMLNTKNNDTLLKLKLAIDEAENRFKSNMTKASKTDIYFPTSYKFSHNLNPNASEDLVAPRGKQFGVSLDDLYGATELPHYAAPIPTVLIETARYFFAQKGQLVVGVFRLAPDSSESGEVMRQIDHNSFRGCSDINCVSNCLKTWFRMLPERLISDPLLADPRSRNPEDLPALLAEHLGDSRRALLQWLLGLLVEVARFEESNRMGAKNLAIVFGPNLVEKTATQAIDSSERACDFLELCINSFMASEESYLERIGCHEKEML